MITDAKDVEILLVEDSPNDAELTIRALKKQHLANRLFHVKDGAEALDFIFARGAYDGRKVESGPKIVLLDLKLPKVDGLEVLKQMKADSRTNLIPVIMMTSSKEERDVIESYKLGVNSYVVKPVDFAQFSKAVENLGLYWLLINHPPKR
jgi:DNA-binding response OmpR family regulator